jgi:hypothetical protein
MFPRVRRASEAVLRRKHSFYLNTQTLQRVNKMRPADKRAMVYNTCHVLINKHLDVVLGVLSSRYWSAIFLTGFRPAIHIFLRLYTRHAKKTENKKIQYVWKTHYLGA